MTLPDIKILEYITLTSETYDSTILLTEQRGGDIIKLGNKNYLIIAPPSVILPPWKYVTLVNLSHIGAFSTPNLLSDYREYGFINPYSHLNIYDRLYWINSNPKVLNQRKD